MSTFKDLVDQTYSYLHSFCGVQEQVTYLTSGVDSAVLTLPVGDASAFSRGLLEIDDELLMAVSSDSTNVVLYPFGRGVRGSTAASHSTNAMVTAAPAFPRVEIKKAINQCVESIYPQLYQVKATTFTFVGAQSTYALPADCDQVLSVTWQEVGPSRYWQPVGSWSFETNSEESTGNAINFMEYVQPGRTVKVVYQAKFSQFVADTDTFASVGLPESFIDILLYGAAAKLLRFLDPARLNLNAVENLSRSQAVAVGDPGKVANQMYAMYQQRMQEERQRLLTLNPPQIHFSR